MQFKILSWNIQQGGGTRAESIVKALLSHHADLIILSEFRNNDSGLLIRIRLLVDGFIFQSPSSLDKETNGVLIASRHRCSFGFATDQSDFPESIIHCSILGLQLFGVYLPHKKKHTRFDYLINESKSLKKIIIAGDFNSGFNYVDQIGDSFWYEPQLRILNSNGITDAFRLLHQDKKEYSWFSHQGNGYRYDHSWISNDLVPHLAHCSYSHAEREQQYSDHSLMVLILNL